MKIEENLNESICNQNFSDCIEQDEHLQLTANFILSYGQLVDLLFNNIVYINDGKYTVDKKNVLEYLNGTNRERDVYKNTTSRFRLHLKMIP